MKIENAIKTLTDAGYEVTDTRGVIFTAKKGGSEIEFIKINDGGDTSGFVVNDTPLPFNSLRAAMSMAKNFE